MSFYDLASKDSLRLKEDMRNDPYYQKENGDAIKTIFEKNASKYNQSPGLNMSFNATGENDPNEKKAMEKLTQLKNEINQKQERVQVHMEEEESNDPPPTAKQVNMEKLQTVMASIKSKNDADPEIEQLNGLLDKLLALKHADKKDSMSIAPVLMPLIYAVQRNNHEPADGLISDTNSAPENGFYELNEDTTGIEEMNKTIEAVIHETQHIVSGSTVKLRLTHTIIINGMEVSAGQFVYGTASLSNERLKILIHSIRVKNSLLPVFLEVFDMDGIEGIYIPGSINRDFSKQSADQALNTIGLAGIDPSIGAQAAGASIQTAKTLLSKKIKLVQVSVEAGYQVLLKDNSRN